MTLPDLPDYVIQAGEQFGGPARRLAWRVHIYLKVVDHIQMTATVLGFTDRLI
jgi:hypothetical protein